MLYVLYIFLIAVTLRLSEQQKCSNSEAKEVDAITAKLITIGNSGRQFPESKGQDFKVYCNESEAYIQQLTNYKNKCMKDLPKQVMGVILYSIKNNINQLCKKESKRLDELIESTPCANKASPEFTKCYTKFIDVLLGAVNTKDNKKKIPYSCCGYHDLFPCFYTRGKRVKSCEDVHLERIQQFIQSLFSDVVNLICGDYTADSDKCQQLGPPPKKRKSQRRTKSFLIPYIDLLSGLPEL